MKVRSINLKKIEKLFGSDRSDWKLYDKKWMYDQIEDIDLDDDEN